MSELVYALDYINDYNDLEDKFKLYSKYVHSIKVNSVYHQVGSDVLQQLSKKYKVDLFYDLKLYDTPLTVYNTITHLPKTVKYITVTYAHNNTNSLKKAYEASIEKGIELYVVTALTSASVRYTTRLLAYDFMCRVVKKFNEEYSTNMGVVVPCNYIDTVKKAYQLKTLTPGLKVDVNNKYSDQTSIGTVLDAYTQEGDLLVLGRNMPNKSEELRVLAHMVGSAS